MHVSHNIRLRTVRTSHSNYGQTTTPPCPALVYRGCQPPTRLRYFGASAQFSFTTQPDYVPRIILSNSATSIPNGFSLRLRLRSRTDSLPIDDCEQKAHHSQPRLRSTFTLLKVNDYDSSLLLSRVTARPRIFPSRPILARRWRNLTVRACLKHPHNPQLFIVAALPSLLSLRLSTQTTS